MIITVHGGHNRIVPGASGLLDEVTEDRNIYERLISYLREAGANVVNTTDNAGRTQSANLVNIATACNNAKGDLNISIHLNAGGGHGVECWCYSASSKAVKYASKICENISSATNMTNRGVKYSTSLYVLRKTSAPTVLVECGFVDSQEDHDKFNADTIAKAIANAVASVAGLKAVTSTATATVAKTESATKTTTNIPVTLRMLRNGDSGSDVKALQILLVGNGFSVGSAGNDGKFGNGTAAALKAYQKHVGLSADAICGKNTWNKILGG